MKIPNSTKYFIDKAREIHKDENDEPLFDYSKTKYYGSKYSVDIICKKCGTKFSQRAGHHLNGSGCKACANNKLRELRLSNRDEFIDKSKNLHGDDYNYDNVDYVNNSTKVSIHCNKCGDDFLQIPNSHLNGNGCPRCAYRKQIETKSKRYDFINKAKNTHKNIKGEPLYDYSKSVYKNMNTPLTIICKKCGKEFLQKPRYHLNGSGCINCYKSRSEKKI